METFGPIPSRRLGKSLGINNLPQKTCSFSCIYCQAGNTTTITAKRRKFFSPDEKRIKTCYHILTMNNINVEYLTMYEGNEFAYTGVIGKLTSPIFN